MPRLYLMRHGQTEFNLAKRVQGRCDSPLTPLGVEQARSAARWLAGQDVAFDTMCASPLGRTRATIDVVRGVLNGDRSTALPPIEFMPGLIERSYGIYESGLQADVPADLWDPGEDLVADGGEGSAAVCARMVDTLTRVMLRPNAETVLAVSHGSATLQFKQAWEHLAECPQDVPLGNCCVLVYRFNPRDRTFICENIVNQA